MTETTVAPDAVTPAQEKASVKTKKAAAATAAPKTSKPRPKASHPSTAEMVNTAIKTLAERSGSSLQAIKKYIASTYKMDAEKHAPFIKKFLKSAVTSGALIQTKGKGASGSFKLPGGKSDAAKTKKVVKAPRKAPEAKKPAAPKKAPVKKAEATKAVATKKPVAPKKAAPAKKPAAEKKVAKAPAAPKVTKPKSPSKAKKATKGPTAKPKAPKPKKTVSKPGKKMAAPKK